MQMLKQENKSAMEAFREVLEKVEQSPAQFTVDVLWVSTDFWEICLIQWRRSSLALTRAVIMRMIMKRKLSTQKVNIFFFAVQCILNMVLLVVDHLIIHHSLFYYDSCDKDLFSFYWNSSFLGTCSIWHSVYVNTIHLMVA